MVRKVLRWGGVGALGGVLVAGLVSAPSPLLALLSWLLFGYLLVAALPRVRSDLRRLAGALRVPGAGRPRGKYAKGGLL